MSTTLSLAQSSFLLSSLVSSPPHRQDGRPLSSFRPIALAPPTEAGHARIKIGPTYITAHSTCQAVRSTASADDTNQENDDDTNGPSSSDNDEGAGLWNVNISTASNVIPPVSNGGNSSQTGCSELDEQLEHLTHLMKKHLTGVVPVDQFIILPNSTSDGQSTHAEKLRGATYWSVHIDITIKSMAGGNLYDAIWASMFASLYRLRIPHTREIAYVPPGAGEDEQTVEEMGIKSLKGQGSNKRKRGDDSQSTTRAVDFELVNGDQQGGKILQGRERVGIGLTLGLLPNNTHLIDPTLEEELALPSLRRLFIVAAQYNDTKHSLRINVTHLLPSLFNLTAGEEAIPDHILDSATGFEIPSDDAIRFPNPTTSQGDGQGSQQKWEDNGTGWGVPSFDRMKVGIQLGMKLAGELRQVLKGVLDKEERKEQA